MYGADGYNIINDTTSYPSYASVTVSGQTAYTWASSTSDVRALQKPASSTDRIAACWYSATNFTIDINLTDNNTHQVAVYALDWDGANTRSSRMEVLDAVTNEVLDSREVTSYSNGKYFVWQLKGHVKLRISHVSPAGANAVISGLFFDSRRNVALAANGATASASSTYTGYPFTPAAVIDGDRKGTNWLSGGGWNDAAPANTFPDWLEINFSGTKTIDEVDVFTVQDNYASPSEPTESMVFSIYGLTGYEVQSWTGSAWQTIPGASITGNICAAGAASGAKRTTGTPRALLVAQPAST